ncbi:MAG: ribbon-helix-helix protein, CopG family [Micrococcales bacterium]|nr:ribbon-helix-helix protein, CopG family [Micrococcales bacterium]
MLANVKVAITLPDDLLAEVDATARYQGVSRSRFFQEAARDHLRRLEQESLTERINVALTLTPGLLEDPEFRAASLRQLATLTRDDEW